MRITIHTSTIVLVGLFIYSGCQSRPDTVACVTADTGVEDFAWHNDTCEAPLQDTDSDLRGTWTGTLLYEQTWNGQTESMDLEVWNLDIGDWSAPRRDLPALGFVGEWNVYASGSHFPSSLYPVLENGGRGKAYAYNENETDGPANGLCLQRGATCATATTFEWQYTAVYVFTDLIHYSLYGYTDKDAPTVQVDGHDIFTLSGGTLQVESSGIGASLDGDPLEMYVTGELVPFVQ